MKKLMNLLALATVLVATIGIPLRVTQASSTPDPASSDGPAAVYTFANPATITFEPDAPYPSTITVAGVGVGDPITDVDLTIYGFSHTYPADVSLLLVSPGGVSTIIVADAGNSVPVTGITVTFDDEAPGPVPGDTAVPSPTSDWPNFNGTYQPTDYADGWQCDTINFPPPAPSSPYPVSLSVFDGLSGTAVNGTWSLYPFDDCGLFSGDIAGGWELIITTATGPASTDGDDVVVEEPVPGCDVLITIPSTAVGATIHTDTPVYWAPGQMSDETFPAPLNVRAIGVDESGMYTKVLYVCGYYWVPTNTIGPNYESPWNGAPLPTDVVD